MVIETQNIDPSNATELDNFYQIGQTIRDDQKTTELKWSEEKNILSFIDEFDVTIKLFSAKSGSDLGRLAAFFFNDTPTQGIIGWFECHDNSALNHILFEEAFTWFKSTNCKSITGPINGCTWNNYRFNKSSEQPLFPSDPYQPFYYLKLWNQVGFSDSINYITEVPPKDFIQPMTFELVSHMLHEHGLKIENLSTLPGDKMKLKLYDFYNLSFSQNPLFRQITKEHYLSLFAKSSIILNGEHSFIVLDPKDNPICIFLCYNDIYHQHYLKNSLTSDDYKTNKLFIKTIATHPDWRNKQLGTLVINLIHNLAYKDGFDEVIHALMYSDNVSAKKGREKFKTKIIREYCLMSKEL